jgi:hypothetical protein
MERKICIKYMEEKRTRALEALCKARTAEEYEKCIDRWKDAESYIQNFS